MNVASTRSRCICSLCSCRRIVSVSSPVVVRGVCATVRATTVFRSRLRADVRSGKCRRPSHAAEAELLGRARTRASGQLLAGTPECRGRCKHTLLTDTAGFRRNQLEQDLPGAVPKLADRGSERSKGRAALRPVPWQTRLQQQNMNSEIKSIK